MTDTRVTPYSGPVHQAHDLRLDFDYFTHDNPNRTQSEAANVQGYFAIEGRGEEAWRTAQKVHRYFVDQKADNNFVFRMLMPFQTRNLRAFVMSILFPVSSPGIYKIKSVVQRILVIIIAACITFVTMPARLTTMIPRNLYQRCLDWWPNLFPLDMDVEDCSVVCVRGERQTINWSRGSFRVGQYKLDYHSQELQRTNSVEYLMGC